MHNTNANVLIAFTHIIHVHTHAETLVHGDGVCGRRRSGHSTQECRLSASGDGKELLCRDCAGSGVHP